jgi:hypothetical protein
MAADSRRDAHGADRWAKRLQSVTRSLPTIALVALAAFVGLTIVMSLWWPLGYDQAIFAVNGSAVVRGSLPYRDAYELRGPLSFYFFAAFELIFGHSASAVRIADALFMISTGALIALLVRRFASEHAAFVTSAIWVLVIISQGANDTAQPDLWVGAFVLGSAMCVTRPRGLNRRALVLAGALLAVPTLFKPFYPVFLAVPGLALVATHGRDLKALMRDVAWVALGWVLPIGAMAAWLWYLGIFQDFVESHLVHTRLYASVADLGRIEGLLTFFLATPVVTVALPAVLAGVLALWSRARALTVALAAALLATTACVVLQRRFLPYHWGPLMPSAVALCGIGLSAAIGESGTSSVATLAARRLGAATLVIVAAAVSLRPAIQLWQWASLQAGRHSEDTYYGRFGETWEVNPAHQRNAATYLRGRTRDAEALGMWAFDAAVPFLANRPLVTRYPISRYLMLLPEHPVTQARRREYMDELRRARPRYFVLNRWDRADRVTRRPPLSVDFPALDSLLVAEYVPDTAFGGIEILRRRSDD